MIYKLFVGLSITISILQAKFPEDTQLQLETENLILCNMQMEDKWKAWQLLYTLICDDDLLDKGQLRPTKDMPTIVNIFEDYEGWCRANKKDDCFKWFERRQLSSNQKEESTWLIFKKNSRERIIGLIVFSGYNYLGFGHDPNTILSCLFLTSYIESNLYQEALKRLFEHMFVDLKLGQVMLSWSKESVDCKQIIQDLGMSFAFESPDTLRYRLIAPQWLG